MPAWIIIQNDFARALETNRELPSKHAEVISGGVLGTIHGVAKLVTRPTGVS